MMSPFKQLAWTKGRITDALGNELFPYEVVKILDDTADTMREAADDHVSLRAEELEDGYDELVRVKNAQAEVIDLIGDRVGFLDNRRKLDHAKQAVVKAEAADEENEARMNRANALLTASEGFGDGVFLVGGAYWLGATKISEREVFDRYSAMNDLLQECG